MKLRLEFARLEFARLEFAGPGFAGFGFAMLEFELGLGRVSKLAFARMPARASQLVYIFQP